MIGIDTTQTITAADFETLLATAQESRKSATFVLADLWNYASVNPEYDDLFHAIHKDTDVALSTIKKYRSTVERFPYHKRAWNVSIDAYYTVKNCDDNTASDLLSQYEDGIIQNRQQLRDMVSGKHDEHEPIKTQCKLIDLVAVLKDYGIQDDDMIDFTAKVLEAVA